MDALPKFYGKEIRDLHDDTLIAVFKKPKNAINFALQIRESLVAKESDHPDWDVTFKIGVSCGLALNANEGFFEHVVRLGKRLSLVAEKNEIVASCSLAQMTDTATKNRMKNEVRVIDTLEEKFLDHLFDITESHLADDRFNVATLSEYIGISRPQLYRKISSTTSLSPSVFIREIRMWKALNLLKSNEFNVSQIAFEVGYSNPSYFSQCFRKKFGINPSAIA